MVKGVFCILLPSESEFKDLGYYYTDKRIDFKITSDLFLRLNLDHSKNEYTLLKLKDISIISYIHKFTGKLARRATGIIIGLLLDVDDKPDKFKTSLKNTAEILSQFDLVEISQGDFEVKLKEAYHEQLESLTDTVSEAALKEAIIEKAKEMLGGSKKDRRDADELLKKIEADLHAKISEHYKIAESAAKTQEFEKAAKFYTKAAEVADELFQTELANQLKEKAKNSSSVPTLTKNLDEAVSKARSFLKNEDFNSSYIWYKKASEIAKDLMQQEVEEEYRLKAKALQDFHQVDQKFKKK